MDNTSGQQTPVNSLPATSGPSTRTPTPTELVMPGSSERQAGSSSTTKRKRADSSDSQVLDILKQSSEAFLRRREMNQRDENVTWGESIGLRLKKMAPMQRAFIRIKVEQLMFDVECAPAFEMPHNGEERIGGGGPTFTTLSSVDDLLQESSSVLSDSFSSMPRV